MVTAAMPEVEAPAVGLDISVPEQLLIATADTLPGWLRSETLGTPKLPLYSAAQPFHGIWEFRAGRGYYELEFIPAHDMQDRHHLAIVVRVIDDVVYAGVRLNLTQFPLHNDLLAVPVGIDLNTGGLLNRAIQTQLHAVAEGKGRGLKTMDTSLTRKLYLALMDARNG